MLALVVAVTSACTTIPESRASLDHVDFTGNHALDSDDLREKIASTETPKFFGLFRGIIYDYEIFDRYVLERDMERVQRYYRAQGFYKTRVRVARVYFTSARHVRVEIVVDEGPPAIVRRVDVHGLEAVPEALRTRLKGRSSRGLALGQPFKEDGLVSGENRLERVLTNAGYARARVQSGADIDAIHDVVAVGYWITPGPLCNFGAVRIEGLGGIPEPPVRRAFDIKPGTPYSSAKLDEAKRALLDLGVFGSVNIEPDLSGTNAGTSAEVPILVRVEPSKLRSLRLGGGVLADSLRTEAHLLGGWEDHNFLGGLRRIQIEVTPGVVFYPTRLPTFEKPQRLLPQGRVRVEFREPSFLEARTNALVRAEASVYPVPQFADHAADIPVLGYGDARTGVGLERSLWKAYFAISQNLQFNVPFTYVGLLDKDLGTALISYPEIFAALDLRDQQLHPHAGLYTSADFQIAGVGGDARDVKTQTEVRGYVPLAKKFTIALRATAGLLFPQNYGKTIETDALTGAPPADFTRRQWVRDVQLVFLRGFFSGGSGSNRGYAAREIGPHGTVPFYNPRQTSAQLTEVCNPQSPLYSAAACDLPLGGFTLWEASVELRMPLIGAFGMALFADSSDVSAGMADFRFNRPHLSVGFGLRYDTPVGPIRFDTGYRIPGMQAPASPDEGQPEEIWGLPIAISFGIGEAF